MPAPLPAHPRRLVYLGTPQAAVPPLRALVEAGFDVALVVSQPDKRRGRGGTLTLSPVKAAALQLGLPVSDRIDDVIEAKADLGVVVAYGRLIKPPVLDVVPMVNVHFSLLPRWRGAAPVERAILAGDRETGTCLMTVDETLDTGNVHARVAIPIGEDVTADELRAQLVALGSEQLVAALRAGLGRGEPQVGEPTYAAKLDPAEFELDWSNTAAHLHRVVRVGGAWTTFRGKRLKVHRARVGDARPDLSPGELDGLTLGTGDQASLVLMELQPEGKARQSAQAWRNGARPAHGEMFAP